MSTPTTPTQQQVPSLLEQASHPDVLSLLYRLGDAAETGAQSLHAELNTGRPALVDSRTRPPVSSGQTDAQSLVNRLWHTSRVLRYVAHTATEWKEK